MGTLSTAYLNALQYAKERVQGPDLKNAMDKNSPRVAIIKHPDVRRMLMKQKSRAEGMRALCLYCADIQDQLKIAQKNNDEKYIQARDIVIECLYEFITTISKTNINKKNYPRNYDEFVTLMSASKSITTIGNVSKRLHFRMSDATKKYL